MDKPWLNNYPTSVPAKSSTTSTLDRATAGRVQKLRPSRRLQQHGQNVTYGEVDGTPARSAYPQSVGLQPGDRVACMMPT